MLPLEKVGSFIAVDASGTEFRINIFVTKTEVTPASNTAGREFVFGKLKHYRTTNGREVFKVGPGSFEIEGTPPIPVTSDDPLAQ